MSFWQSIGLAISALRAHPLRSLLTTLGIVLGVAAVVCMVAVGEGARAKVSDKVAMLGTDLLFIEPYSEGGGGGAALTEDDAAAIRHEVSAVQIAAPIIWGSVQVIAGNRNLKTTVWGNDSDYLLARRWELNLGRTFSRDEIARGSKVVILGNLVAKKLFETKNPIGETMRINDVPFTVIGVLERKGESGQGHTTDNLIVVPLRAARSRVLGSALEQESDQQEEKELTDTEKKKQPRTINYAHESSVDALDYLVVKYDQDASSEETKRAIESVLATRRQVHDVKSMFGVLDPADALATQEATARSFSWLLSAIASISLAVGGLSIMNTMLVSVGERTREIGLRMAVGARRRDIRNQFLLEAMALALFGALLGTMLGSITAILVARYGEWPVLISPVVVLFACGFTSMVGILFGLFPAYRAASLDPMVALRCE